MYSRILVATDGSYHSRLAEERAISLAKVFSSKLSAVYVVDFSRYTWAEELMQEVYLKVKREGEKVLEDFRKRAEEEGIYADTILVEGYPATEIARLSAEYDLLVIGSRGAGEEELSLGSVAEKLTRRAKSDLLVVK